jgi:hypothetical protein
MGKGSSEVDAARLLPKLVDLVSDSLRNTAAASEAMDARRMGLEMAQLGAKTEEAGAWGGREGGLLFRASAAAAAAVAAIMVV